MPTGATSVPGLFAAGEAVGGLHGANRMGGNALSETLVFGARAGSAAAGGPARSEGGDPAVLGEGAGGWRPQMDQGTPSAPSSRNALEGSCGRTAESCARQMGSPAPCRPCNDIQQEASISSSELSGKELIDLIELRSAAKVAGIILEAAS